MKAIIVERFNGWELSREANGPLVRYEDVREAVEQHNALVARIAELELENATLLRAATDAGLSARIAKLEAEAKREC